MTNLADELERLAREATPGKLYVSLFEIATRGKNRMVMGGDGFAVAYVGHRSEAENEADAALIVALRNALPQIISALRREEWQGIETGKVYVTVSGRTGTGKSAVLGEIEIAMRALGLTVETDRALQSEKNMTGADWVTALELYKPVVVLREVNLPSPPKGTDHE